MTCPASWLAEALHDVEATRLRHGGWHRYGFRLGAASGRRIHLPAPDGARTPTVDLASDRARVRPTSTHVEVATLRQD